MSAGARGAARATSVGERTREEYAWIPRSHRIGRARPLRPRRGTVPSFRARRHRARCGCRFLRAALRRGRATSAEGDGRAGGNSCLCRTGLEAENRRDGPGVAQPCLRLGAQEAPTCRGETVVARAPIVVRYAPLGVDVAAPLEAVQRLVQRAVVDCHAPLSVV